jgi:hypothetical protein
MTVARINERLLQQLGFDRTTIEALRHLMEKVGGEIGSSLVISVNDKSGVVVLTTDDIDEGAAQYFTQARARESVSASGSGLSYDSATGEFESNGTDANTASTLVFRDASGNFSAGTITANLSGNADTATTADSAAEAAHAASADEVPFSGVAGKPATASGYGIASIDAIPIGATTPSAGSFSSVAASGDMTYSATGQRIKGDMSNATASNRLALQNSTANAGTTVSVIPNGSGATAGVNLETDSTMMNSVVFNIVATATDCRLNATKRAGGALLPMTFYTNGSESARIDTSGNLLIQKAGAGLRIKEGANAKMGTATLVAGAATVANTSITASSRIFLTSQADGGTPGWLRVSARVAGTSFTITSSDALDTSTVAYLILEPS